MIPEIWNLLPLAVVLSFMAALAGMIVFLELQRKKRIDAGFPVEGPSDIARPGFQVLPPSEPPSDPTK